MKPTESDSERWLRPSEVSALFQGSGLFRVPLSTLRSWATAGRIPAVRTPGGHRRYRESDALALLAELQAAA